MKSYDEFVSDMSRAFTSRAGYSPDEASDIGIRIRVLAGELYNLQSNIQWLKQQVFPQTAQGEYLDYHAQLRGLQRKEAVKAKGTVYFSLTQNAVAKVEIPKGTIVSTTGSSPVSFETTEYCCIDVGKRAVSVSAVALEGGTSGNVISGSVTAIVTMTVENLSVTNMSGFQMGADAETDSALRVRIINSLKYIDNGTNIAYYRNLAKTISGVECVNVVPKRDGSNIVNIYICGREQKVSQPIVDEASQLISKQREINVDVRVKAAELCQCVIEISVKLADGYSINDVKLQLTEKIKELLSMYEVGQSLKSDVLSDLLYHQEGILQYQILPASTGLTVKENEKIVLNSISLREAS